MKFETMRFRSRRLIAASAVLACAVLFLTGFTPSTRAASGGNSKLVAFVPGFFGIGFYNAVYAGVRDQAKKYGWKTIQQGSDQAFSPAAQTPYVRAVCTQKPALLVIAPTDPVAMRAPIQACMNLGVKVVIVDTNLTNSAGVISSIATDNAEGGTLAGKFIAKALGGKGVVSMHTGQPQATTQAIRIKAAQNVLNKYPGITELQIIADATPDAAFSSTQASLVGNPDIAAIFDESGGCVQEEKAVSDAGKKALVVCFDASVQQDPLLQAGKLAALVVQPAYQEGTLAVQYGHDYITGQKALVKKHVQLNDVMVTAANANKPQFQQILKDGGGS